MTNTGTWNSDFALFFLFVFFSPVVLFFAAGVFLKLLEAYLLIESAKNACDELEPVYMEPQVLQVERRQEPEQKQDDDRYADDHTARHQKSTRYFLTVQLL